MNTTLKTMSTLGRIGLAGTAGAQTAEWTLGYVPVKGTKYEKVTLAIPDRIAAAADGAAQITLTTSLVAGNRSFEAVRDGLLLMTLPIILPVVLAAGWDPLWFGIVLVMLVEIGMITPPVGMILYVLSGVSEGRVSLGQISVGALPFVGAFLAMVFAFYAVPELVTFLPNLMR